MKHHLFRYVLSIGLVISSFVGSIASTPSLGPKPEHPTPFEVMATISSPSIVDRKLPPATTETPSVSSLQLPSIPGLTRLSEFDVKGNLVFARYQNPQGAPVATSDPQDSSHNNGVAWYWEEMTPTEKSQALRWIFDPQHMRYIDFEHQESWVVNAITQWIPRINDLASPIDPRVASHWPADDPPMNQTTLYEALSRIKTLALVRERGMCSFGYSDRGQIEYGGEIVLFTAPAWQHVSLETREIVSAAWTNKEAMVIYYPQSLRWADSCPSDAAHLKNEYYSTIWLLEVEQALSKFVPADAAFWAEQEIPFQVRNLQTATIPRCVPPARFPNPNPTSGAEGYARTP